MRPPQDTSPAASASTLPDRPPAATVPPSVAQTCAAPPGCLSECRARPRAGPLAATPARLAARLAQGLDKPLAVGVVAGDRFAPVPTVHDVVHGPGVLNPKFARHTVPCGRIRSGRPRVKRQLTNSRD